MPNDWDSLSIEWNPPVQMQVEFIWVSLGEIIIKPNHHRHQHHHPPPEPESTSSSSRVDFQLGRDSATRKIVIFTLSRFLYLLLTHSIHLILGGVFCSSSSSSSSRTTTSSSRIPMSYPKRTNLLFCTVSVHLLQLSFSLFLILRVVAVSLATLSLAVVVVRSTSRTPPTE